MGKESRGWHWGGIGVVAIWLLTRRGGKADRTKGTGMRGGREEGRGAHTGRTTRSPSAKSKSSRDLCVFMLTHVRLSDNAADPIQHGVMRADSADATNLDSARGARLTESQRHMQKDTACSLLSARCVFHA